MSANGTRIIPRIILFTLLISTSACSGRQIFPGPIFTANFPPAGPENYRVGMTDGCKTAISAVGVASAYGFTANGYQVDVDRSLNDHVYYRAWKDGYNFCKYEQEGIHNS